MCACMHACMHERLCVRLCDASTLDAGRRGKPEVCKPGLRHVGVMVHGARQPTSSLANYLPRLCTQKANSKSTCTLLVGESEVSDLQRQGSKLALQHTVYHLSHPGPLRPATHTPMPQGDSDTAGFRAWHVGYRAWYGRPAWSTSALPASSAALF